MLENDNSSDNSTESSEAIAPEIEAKFAEVFNQADAADAGGEQEAPVTQKAPQFRPSPAKVRQSKQEAQDELVEEGLIDGNNPDGKPADGEEATAEEGEEQAEEQSAEGEEKPDDKTPRLDPNLRFAAQEFGWTDEKINKLLTTDPELAEETFQRLADTYTNLSRQLLNPGTQQVAGSQETVTPAQPGPLSPLDGLLSPKALAEFAEVNGEDLVEKFLKPFAQERQALMGEVKELKAYVEVQKRQFIAQEAQGTMTKLSDKFGEVYGVGDKTTWTQTQQTARATLANIADQIRAGAKLQGVEMSVTDAINRAHLIVTADSRTADGRKQVKEQIQKRSKSITAKPTTRRATASASPRSDSAALEAATRKMAELGMEVE
jgi:hypothetical protein